MIDHASQRASRAFSIAAIACCLATSQPPIAFAEASDSACRTTARYLADHPPPESGGCTVFGDCDIPETRDGHIPDGTTLTDHLRMKITILAEDDGTNPAATLEEAEAQVEQLNADLIPLRLQFDVEIAFAYNSDYRIYDPIEEYFMKQELADSPETKLNVYVLQTTNFSFATFPWDPDALTFEGGIIMHQGHFGPGRSILTHEVGHSLGLWHTYHGVSEVPDCSPCYESADGVDGDITGDYCSDTPPTPLNVTCGPIPGIDPCSSVIWEPTDYENYMGLAPDSCYTHFTAQQMGRQRCWLENVLSGWRLPPINDGDFNRDGDIDLFDFQQFTACVTGPGGFIEEGCQPADIDTDGDVDLLDFGEVIRTFTGNCGALITHHPDDVTVCLSDSATFLMGAVGIDLDLFWTRNGTVIPGEVSSVLTIHHVDEDHLGQYAGHAVSECHVAHTADAVLASPLPPIITDVPDHVMTCIGEPASFTVDAVGFGPLSYQWRLNGVDIQGAEDATHDIRAVQPEDLGTYSCTITDVCGRIVSTGEDSATLTLIPPVITTQPHLTYTCEGLTAELVVEADGQDPVTYQWRFEGVAIPGANEPTLVIENVTERDLGIYTCLISDACGGQVVSANGRLVYSEVVIDNPPAGGEFCEGSNVFLLAGVSGAFEIQWFKDGQPIPDAHQAFLIISNATSEDSGAYHVEAQSLCNEVVSDAAIVEIIDCG